MREKELKIAPSILSADFAEVGSALLEIADSGCDYVHLDVMDGAFVPPITFGAKLIKDIRERSDLIFDCHLMVANPESKIPAFIEAGADIITIHQEATTHIMRALEMIHEGGKEAGVSINPGTPISSIIPVLPHLDLVLIMTVNPGWGGQKLIVSVLDKINKLDEIREREGYRFLISVDGGINLDNIRDIYLRGADIAVMGSAFFSEEDKAAFVETVMERLW